MLDSLTSQPAYVLGRRWDVLAWNRAAELLFEDYGKLDGDERNIMHIVFANKAHRRLLVDWEKVASTALAMFRADSARYAGDPDFERLIGTLKRVSPSSESCGYDRTWYVPWAATSVSSIPSPSGRTSNIRALLSWSRPT
jgi:hypothetical protein